MEVLEVAYRLTIEFSLEMSQSLIVKWRNICLIDKLAPCVVLMINSYTRFLFKHGNDTYMGGIKDVIRKENLGYQKL